MAVESIFAKQWWAVALRPARPGTSRLGPKDKLEAFAGDVARSAGGLLHKNAKTVKPGVFVATLNEALETKIESPFAASALIFQTETTYFPLAEENLETGPVELDQIGSCERDFPRRLTNGRNTVFQYPLLSAFSPDHLPGGTYILASPYFLLLREIIKGLQQVKTYSACIGVDVAKVFAQLDGLTIKNGDLTVRSGRMIITGIEYLRSAVFFGDNVIKSPLYSDLIGTEGVTVNPKDCRLGRSFIDPVGGNRRPFICWFDPHGNYRFTPGGDTVSSTAKFLELLNVLSTLKLVRDTDTFNPLARIGRNTPSS